MEIRKQKEAEFHNKWRDEKLERSQAEYKHLTISHRFYSITRASWTFVNNWLIERCANKRVLDYCCGAGDTSIFLAKNRAEVVGIDISETSIKKTKQKAAKEGVEKNASFLVMDAEKLNFSDNYFDLILCNGVLHHLDIKNVYPELMRVLKSDGAVICDEPLAYNPIFQLYRRMTPYSRTEWEMKHILTKKEIELAKKYFNNIETKFFHLTTLMAVPFRNLAGFNSILGFFERVDSILLRSPILKWLAWQVVFILSNPKKDLSMELRKQKEIEYYNKKVEKQMAIGKEWDDFEGFTPFLLESYKSLKTICQSKCQNKKILDYGCGNGVHSQWLEDISKELIGIDLSQKSLDIAKKRTRKTKFLLMDCENMDFPDNSFDVVFDGGTFSSLDLKRAFLEIARVLKPDGFLVGIETLGHNPLTNLKRKINKLIGKRTEWAAGHIFKIENLKLAEKHFQRKEIYFFHLISWLAFPFLKIPGAKPLLHLLEKIDHILLFIFPFLKRYSFKIVFVFSYPQKYAQKNI